jgi:hypothetical protein
LKPLLKAVIIGFKQNNIAISGAIGKSFAGDNKSAVGSLLDAITFVTTVSTDYSGP